jgi:ABC-type antimicrobial peptide transport system permease subunit
VLSYLVRGRRREIGIRTALGAGTTDVLRMVLIEGLKPTLIGIALGVAGALWRRGCSRSWSSASRRRIR